MLMNMSRHEWTRINKHGQEWTRMDQNGQEWTRMNKNGQEWFDPHVSNLDRTRCLAGCEESFVP
jgi:hypothetical protein